jgi:hypothetical protein
VNQLLALSIAVTVSLYLSTFISVRRPLHLFLGSFAALLVVGYQFARARPVPRQTDLA